MKKSIFVLLLCSLYFFPGCKDKNDCQTTGNCSLEPDAGICKAAIPRYYFDKDLKVCREFLWGGCDGVVPFETMEECSTCECN